MFFKNLVLYRLAEPMTLDPMALEPMLEACGFRPCGGLEPFSYGFDAPMRAMAPRNAEIEAAERADGLVHAAAGRILICTRREERLLPAAVIREAMDNRIAEIEVKEFRNVHRKERQRIRDDVTFDLLPRAFTKSIRTYAYLCPAEGWLVVDAATSAKAEDLANLLSHAANGLAIVPYVPDTPVAQALTRWLRTGDLPSGIGLLDECEMRDPALEGSLVRCQRQDLVSDEIRAHLRANKEVRRLGLTYEDQFTFALTADMHVKRIHFEGVEPSNEQADFADLDAPARLDADFAFMTSALAPLLRRLLQIFGEAA